MIVFDHEHCLPRPRSQLADLTPEQLRTHAALRDHAVELAEAIHAFATGLVGVGAVPGRSALAAHPAAQPQGLTAADVRHLIERYKHQWEIDALHDEYLLWRHERGLNESPPFLRLVARFAEQVSAAEGFPVVPLGCRGCR